MKILSVRQPWAALIVTGFKDVENRTWPTKISRSRFGSCIAARRRYEERGYRTALRRAATGRAAARRYRRHYRDRRLREAASEQVVRAWTSRVCPRELAIAPVREVERHPAAPRCAGRAPRDTQSQSERNGSATYTASRAGFFTGRFLTADQLNRQRRLLGDEDPLPSSEAGLPSWTRQ